MVIAKISHENDASPTLEIGSRSFIVALDLAHHVVHPCYEYGDRISVWQLVVIQTKFRTAELIDLGNVVKVYF